MYAGGLGVDADPAKAREILTSMKTYHKKFQHLADPAQLNVVSFKWDPTRDTGVFIKVNCISTEFTPKKHGGEKGVPFRLQVHFC